MNSELVTHDRENSWFDSNTRYHTHFVPEDSLMLDTELLFRYECEGLDTDDEVITLFQQIYDTQAYKWLQGHYGRMLQQLIEEDLIDL